jgi:two-component system, OmpR family, sensor histidine kinase KdpD
MNETNDHEHEHEHGEPDEQNERRGQRVGGSSADVSHLSDEVEPAGPFRIYLGSAAGVGKSVAMLDEGWRRARRGRDVVVGFVETHGRRHTAEQIRDLEVVPRKKIAYRGSEFEEMDLEGVLARHPEVVLIDELAHTNVPGSGQHAKRWQDVLQILESGSSVVTTVNIQHLESLADAVERITGVRVAERVPDWVVRKADQIELIDSSAEQLRRRMVHGNIYPPEKVPAALSGFFRVENLVALRELALRFVADETEEELLHYLATQHGQEAWDTNERIMVAVSGAPGIDSVVRRAARITARVKGDLLAVHVADDCTPAEGLTEVRQLVDDVGGEWHELVGDDPAATVVDFARKHFVTQIVIGATRRSRWEEVTKGSVVRKILREAAASGVDVHVIARRRPASEEEALPAPTLGADDG